MIKGYVKGGSFVKAKCESESIFWVDLGVVDFGGGFQLDSAKPKRAQVDS